jgi:hypothetical protein
MTRPSVPFHDAPTAGASKYADVIAKAKAGQVAERPGDLVNTPSFDETQRSWESRKPQKTQLSAKTTSGLSALAERNAQLERPPADAPGDDEDDSSTSSTETAPEPSKAAPMDETEKLRKSVEARIVGTIDIGQYLINGEVTQLVPIIPGKLEVTFRSVTDLEEAYVDAQLSKNKELTTRTFVRMSNEWALAFHINSVGSNRWPPTVVDGKINEAALEKRLGHVRKLSSPIFQLLAQNLVWFLERVSKSITMEVLGNG